MKAYKTFSTVDASQNITLSDLPFAPGQKIEVLLLETQKDTKSNITTLKKLFKKTQSLAHVKKITEEDIEKEIRAYRSIA